MQLAQRLFPPFLPAAPALKELLTAGSGENRAVFGIMGMAERGGGAPEGPRALLILRPFKKGRGNDSKWVVGGEIEWGRVSKGEFSVFDHVKTETSKFTGSPLRCVFHELSLFFVPLPLLWESSQEDVFISRES